MLDPLGFLEAGDGIDGKPKLTRKQAAGIYTALAAAWGFVAYVAAMFLIVLWRLAFGHFS